MPATPWLPAGFHKKRRWRHQKRPVVGDPGTHTPRSTHECPLNDALRRALETVSLDDKYTLERGRIYISGTQALVRLPMLQQERDRAAG